MHILAERAVFKSQLPNLLRMTQSFLWHGLLLMLCLLALPAKAQETDTRTAEKEFTDLVRLAPMIVQGQPVSISVFARSRSDRRYGEKFADEVVQVLSETITSNTGRGLIIIGAKGEPHPIFVFRNFVALAKAGRLDPEIAALSPTLEKEMQRWEEVLNQDEKKEGKPKGDVDLDYEKILTAIPIPLQGLGAKLYQLAWEEKFDPARVETRLCGLHRADLDRRELFKRYDWAFYLPPKGVFNKVIDDLISDALKEEEIGFFTRVAIKGVLLAVKPKIRRAIEGFRQGMLFMTLLEARTPYDHKQVKSLTEAFVSPSLPDEKSEQGTERERRIHSLEKRLGALGMERLP